MMNLKSPAAILTGTLLAASLALAPWAAAESATKPKPAAKKDDGHDHDHGTSKKDPKAKKDHHDHHHHHEAPHGGTLVALGDHFAHVELVLDGETGRLTAYVLDGEAAKPIRLKQDSLVIEAGLTKDGKASTETLTLRPVSNVLTGEKVGDTSQFEFGFDALKGVKKFEAVLQEITIKGKTLKQVPFRFPEGNEE